MHTFKHHIKQTIQLAYPVAIGQLGHIMMGVVDSLMVGKVGAVPLAASSIATGLFFIIFVIGLGVTFAISPLVAIALGAKKYDECGIILRQGLIVNLAIGLLIFLILFFGADLIQHFGQAEEVSSQAIQYLKIISLSVIPMMLFQTYRQFIEGFSIMRPAMVITILANIINVFGNWIFIFGNLGMPKLGLAGAGLSTLVTRTFMAFLIFYYISSSEGFKLYDVTLRFKKIDFNIIKRILKIGLPSGFQYFFEVGAFSSAAIIIGWIGTKELAAHQIALNLASVTYMIVTGISAAAAIRVGSAVGSQDISETRRAGFSSILLAASLMAFFGILFILLKDFLPALYINDSAVISIASSLLVIAAFFQISDGTQAVGLGVLRGLTDVKIPTIITFIAYWLLALPSGYILAFYFNLGVYGVWIGFIIGLYASAIMLTIRFNIRSKKKIHI